MSVIQLLYQDVPRLHPMPFTNLYKVNSDMEVRYSIDKVTKSVVITKGFLTDGASIPRVLWSVVGSPYQPRFIAAAVYHDWACKHSFNVAEMSEVFRLILKSSNVSSLRANAMHKAVYAFKTIF